MATFTVNTVNDIVSATDGLLSLREAVAQANNNGGLEQYSVQLDTEGSNVVVGAARWPSAMISQSMGTATMTAFRSP